LAPLTVVCATLIAWEKVDLGFVFFVASDLSWWARWWDLFDGTLATRDALTLKCKAFVIANSSPFTTERFDGILVNAEGAACSCR
jgi:hypothetical protein